MKSHVPLITRLRIFSENSRNFSIFNARIQPQFSHQIHKRMVWLTVKYWLKLKASPCMMTIVLSDVWMLLVSSHRCFAIKLLFNAFGELISFWLRFSKLFSMQMPFHCNEDQGHSISNQLSMILNTTLQVNLVYKVQDGFHKQGVSTEFRLTKETRRFDCLNKIKS